MVISDGDSVVLQTLEQTRWVSKQIEIGKSCELSGIQKDSIINRYKSTELYFNGVILMKDEIIKSKDSTIVDKESIINSHKKINGDLIKENKDLKLKNTLTLIGCGIIVTIVLIFGF